MAGAPQSIRDILRALKSFPPEMPEFDTRTAPDSPVTLFLAWLNDAIANQEVAPHAMTLATTDGVGSVSSRVLICKDVDEAGRWYFRLSAESQKGRELAKSPHAALSFYWPELGRQIRIRGAADPADSQASAADFLARSPAARADALIGRQSEPLQDPAELDAALRHAKSRVAADPGQVAPAWTLYAVSADDVEFWQADHQRRHTRLRYQRTASTWTRSLLWP